MCKHLGRAIKQLLEEVQSMGGVGMEVFLPAHSVMYSQKNAALVVIYLVPFEVLHAKDLTEPGFVVQLRNMIDQGKRHFVLCCSCVNRLPVDYIQHLASLISKRQGCLKLVHVDESTREELDTHRIIVEEWEDVNYHQVACHQ